jgi:hypothetical protein
MALPEDGPLPSGRRPAEDGLLLEGKDLFVYLLGEKELFLHSALPADGPRQPVVAQLRVGLTSLSRDGFSLLNLQSWFRCGFDLFDSDGALTWFLRGNWASRALVREAATGAQLLWCGCVWRLLRGLGAARTG